jgi:solute:Na+ symporter, SSS family
VSLPVGPIDLGIIVAYLTGTLALGLWIGRGQKEVSGYLLGDRDLPWWLVLLTIVATETSAVTFLSIPGTAFKGDMRFLQLPIGYLIGRYAVVWLLLPRYFRGELYTAYQVLHERFGGLTSRAASLLFLVARTLGDGFRLFLAALVVKAMLFSHGDSAGPDSAGQPIMWAILIAGGVTIAYTFFGGLKAVAWTDFVQFFVYVAGAIAALALLISRLDDDWRTLLELGTANGKFTMLDFRLDLTEPYTLWAGLFGGAFLSLGTHGADQLSVQRYLAARSQSDAARAVAWSGWIVFAQTALFLTLGVGLFCFYQDRVFQRGDDVFATFIVDELPVGVKGLTLAAVFAAAMSTTSGSLNSSAAVAFNDFYLPAVRRSLSDRHAMVVTKSLTILFGVLQVGVALAAQYMQKAVVDSVLTIAGVTTGVVLGLFFLAMAPMASSAGAVVAFATGLGVVLSLLCYSELAWPWFALIGSMTTLAVGLLVSLFAPRSSAEEDR